MQSAAEVLEAAWQAEAQIKAERADYSVSNLSYRLARYQHGSLSLNHEAAHNRRILRRALNIAIDRAGKQAEAIREDRAA